MTYLLKNHKILPVFAFLALIVILMPLQNAYAIAITSVTINSPIAGQTFGAGFSIDYTVADDGANGATAGSITFTRTGGTADAGPHVYTMSLAAPDDTSTGNHVITRVTLEGDGGFVALVDGSVYTIVVSVTDGAAFTDTEEGVTADFTLPTFTAALGPASNQITITYSENVISAADSTTPWAVTGGFTVNAVTALDGGTSTQTLTLDVGITDGSSIQVTYTVGGNGDITDDINLSPNALATATVTLGGVPPFSGQGSGCTGDCSAPTLGVNSEGNRYVTNGFTYNGKSTDVESFFTPYPLITANVGQQNKAVFKIYENYGPQNVAHFSLAFGLGDDQIISQSKAMIELDIDFTGIETVTITDPENALDNVKVRTSTGNCNDGDSAIECLIVTIDHTFRAPLDFNIVGTDVWDYRLNSWQNYYNHGIEVVGESLNPPNEYFGIYNGNLIHLVETAKNTAIDADGNTWTFDNIWIKDYINKGKIEDPISSQGYDRNHVKFNAIMQEQELVARSLMEKYYKTSVSQEPAFEEINDIYPTFVSQGFDRDHPDFAAYQQEQVQIALSFLKEHFPEYASESFAEINNVYSYEYSEQNEQDSVIKKHNINEEVKKAQQTIQEYYKSSYQ